MKSILLIGLGRFGATMAMKLHELKHEVMAIDISEERINAILPYVTSAQIGDCTNEQYMSSIGVRNFDLCIVAIGDNFQSSLETTALLKDLALSLYSPAPTVIFTPSFCFETARIRLSIQKKRWQSGQPSATAPIIFSTTSN